MSDFELLEPTPHLVLKSFHARDRHDSSEQTILGMLKTLEAPFLPRVCWSFRDEDNYHMVMVCMGYPRVYLIALPKLITLSVGILPKA
jgi:hypothetical protein